METQEVSSLAEFEWEATLTWHKIHRVFGNDAASVLMLLGVGDPVIIKYMTATGSSMDYTDIVYRYMKLNMEFKDNEEPIATFLANKYKLSSYYDINSMLVEIYWQSCRSSLEMNGGQPVLYLQKMIVFGVKLDLVEFVIWLRKLIDLQNWSRHLIALKRFKHNFILERDEELEFSAFNSEKRSMVIGVLDNIIGEQEKNNSSESATRGFRHGSDSNPSAARYENDFFLMQ